MKKHEPLASLFARVIAKSSQRHEGDLSNMIIVNSAIFRQILSKLNENQLAEVIAANLMPVPLLNEIEFGEWFLAQFAALGERVGAKTQAEFGQIVGLKQSDASKLINHPEEFSISIEKKKQIETKCRELILEISKKAS